MSKKEIKDKTKLIHLGRNPDDYYGVVNPPIVKTSTILYPSLAAYEDKDHKYRYGRLGTPLSDHFEGALAELEGGYAAVATSSGLGAVTTALQSFLKAGDHILVADAIYPPTRFFCDNVLGRFGVEVEYYDPLIGAGIEELIRYNTAVIYMESPGSATFEIQDVPAIAKIARQKDVITIIDNTWSAGVLFKPLVHGVDISLQSAAKYIGGHSDVNLGVVVASTEALYKRLKKTAVDLGQCGAPDDMYLALRGLRTLEMRIRQAGENGLRIAKFLQGRDEVERVFFPALSDDPNHKLWKRDFAGTNGVLSFHLKTQDKEPTRRFIESLALFPIGSSWGGYESLLQPQYLRTCRSARKWEDERILMRLQVGLEDVDDLTADLEQAFSKL